MRKLINIMFQTAGWQFFLLVTFFIISSCSKSRFRQPADSLKTDTFKPAVTIAATTPIVTYLDTCPEPATIAIPAKQGGSYIIKTNSGLKTIQLLPPETKPAVFFVPMQNYNTAEGLALNSVLSSSTDKKGNLWFGTEGGGVSRYDGKSFTSYSASQGLASNNVLNILEDKSGNLWFCTLSGVSCYDGKSFTNYTTIQGLANNAVRGILEDKSGNLWFGTRNGVSRLKQYGKSVVYGKASFTNYTIAHGLADNYVSSILEDKSGNLWFGTFGGGVSRYDGKSFINYTAAQGLANNVIKSMIEDKSGNLWFGTENGISRLPPDWKSQPHGKPGFINYTTRHGLINNNILSILEDKSGSLWFGTAGGASLFNRKSLPGSNVGFINYTILNGLTNNRVTAIIQDKSENIWFSTADGISRLDRDWQSSPDGSAGFTSYATLQGVANNSVTSILEDSKGNFWFGTLGVGAFRLNRNTNSFTSYTIAQGLVNNVVRSIIEDRKGNFWFVTDGGVSRLDQQAKFFTNYTAAQGLANNLVRCISEDKSGNLWFGTMGGGVSRLDRGWKSFTTYTTAQGLGNNFVRNLIEDKSGNIWFGTLGGGVSRLDKDRKFFTNYTTINGLVTNYVWNLFEDNNGNLWLGTEVGVSRFDGKYFINYTTAQGMSDNGVGDIVMDKKGIIWMGTIKGFTALKSFVQDEKNTSYTSRHNLPPANQLSNHELITSGYNPGFEIYNIKTGYPVNDINLNALYVTREGIIWAGTSNKLIRFDYNSLQKNPRSPDVFIQSIKINNENICWYHLAGDKEKTDSITTPPNITEEIAFFGKILSEAQRDTIRKKFSGVKFDSITRFSHLPLNLILPYRHNNVTFDFTAIEPAKPFLVRYQYMLEGYDEEWSPVLDKTSATFGNIHEGNYTFKLRALSPDGVWSVPVTYSFKVLSPWYRSWWAYALYFMVFLAALWSFIKWREKALKKEAQLKQQKTEFEMQALRAQMNPHFIFNSLNSINRFILQNNKAQASEYLTKFSKLVRMILQNSQASLITLDSELESLQLYLEMEALRFNYHFDYKISVPKDLDVSALKVPPLIIQPFAENAIWHGLMHKEEKGQLDIEVSQENDFLYFKIADDGIGRTQAALLKGKSATKHKSVGLKITADRIALTHGSNGNESPVKINDLVHPDGSAAGTEVIIKMPVIYD